MTTVFGIQVIVDKRIKPNAVVVVSGPTPVSNDDIAVMTNLALAVQEAVG